MSKVHNQHFMPQFLQRNFAIDANKTKVQIYETPLNPKQPSSIKYASIKHNMSSEYTYGPSQVGENLLSRIECEASDEIRKMIKSPKKYMRQNPKLPDSMLDFMASLTLRGIYAQAATEALILQLIDYLDEQPESVDSQPSVFKQWKRDNLDTNEVFGHLIQSVENIKDAKTDLYNGEYTLVQSDNFAFLPDNVVVGVLPITPHLLLSLNPGTLHKHISETSSSYIFDFYNFLALHQMSQRIIISKHTTQSYISKLQYKFEHIKPYLPDDIVGNILDNMINDIIDSEE